MPFSPRVIAIALSGLALADLIMCHERGLGVSNWSRTAIVGLAIAAIGLFYGLSGRSRQIAQMATWTLLWVAFSIAGAVLTYATVAPGTPLRDPALAAIDHALGFDWSSWFAFVHGHAPLHDLLVLAYASLMPQILIAIFYFSWRGAEERSGELLACVILALVATTILFSLLPALGPGAGIPRFRAVFVDELVALHDGRLKAVDLMQMKGIISFPSFHAVLAVLFAYAWRGTKGFVPLAVLNGLVLLSVPSEGGHYLIDLIAGVGVAILAIGAVQLRQPVLARADAA